MPHNVVKDVNVIIDNLLSIIEANSHIICEEESGH